MTTLEEALNQAAGLPEYKRRTYRHEECGSTTVWSRGIAMTYAADPSTGAYCSNCKRHFPVGTAGEFVWEDTGTKVKGGSEGVRG